MNVLGKTVYTIEKKSYPSGEHTIPVTINTIPAGMYYISISDGIISINKALVITTN